MIDQRLQRLRERLWAETEQRRTSRRQAKLIGRYVFVLLRDLFEGQITMRAMSLVYTSLLSFVPLLALAFSVLKALGVHNSLEPVLVELLRPLGEQGTQISDNVIGFVDRMQVGVLGSVGVVLLFYTALSLIQKVEASFNFIWGVERLRPLAQRVGEYLALLLFGPVMAFTVLTITAAVLENRWLVDATRGSAAGAGLAAVSSLVPYVLIIGFFTFIYAFIPNTRVRLRPAAIGGIIAGLLWQTSSFAFARFAASATNYNAVYSGFAIIILLLLWLYIGWLVVLTGCQLTYYLQNPHQLLQHRRHPLIMGRSAEVLGLTVMAITARQLLDGRPPIDNQTLERQAGAPPGDIGIVVQALIDAGLLIEAGEDAGGLIPARDLSSLTLGEIVAALRRAGRSEIPRHPYARALEEQIGTCERLYADDAGRVTLREWLLQHPL